MITFLKQTKDLIGNVGLAVIENDWIAVGEGENIHLSNLILHHLNQGATEISNRMVSLQPQIASEFADTYTIEDNMGVMLFGEVISVVRENGKKGSLEPCSPVSPSLRFKVTDSDSLEYRSKFNPCYYIAERSSEWADGENSTNDNGTWVNGPRVYIAPIPTYTQNSVYERGYVTLRHSLFSINDSTAYLEAFPMRYQYLIPLYAAIQLIKTQISSKSFEDEDEETTDVMIKALADYKTQYDEAFQYLGAQGGGEDEG